MSFLNCSNKRDKIILVMLCFFLFVTAVNAQEGILNLVLIKDESGIRVMDRIVGTSKIESQSTNLAGYKLVIKDLDDLVLEIITFGFSNNVAIVSFPISQNFLKGEIYDDKDNFILVIDLFSHIDVGLCGDNTCSADETSENCPGDCSFEKEFETDEEKQSSFLFLSLIIIVIVLLVISLIYLKKQFKSKERTAQPQKIKPIQQPIGIEQQLQKYIQDALIQGLNKEEIKEGLLKSNWPLELIEKNLK